MEGMVEPNEDGLRVLFGSNRVANQSIGQLVRKTARYNPERHNFFPESRFFFIILYCIKVRHCRK